MSRQFLITLGAIAAIFLLAILVVPVMDINKTQHANEATAVARLLRINALERDYARSNAEGFACSLEKLKPAGPENDPYDKDEFLLTGENIGYRLVLFECQKDSNGIVTKYGVSAVPIQPGKSGFRYFCTDQTGVIRYGHNGSAEECLKTGIPLML